MASDEPPARTYRVCALGHGGNAQSLSRIPLSAAAALVWVRRLEREGRWPTIRVLDLETGQEVALDDLRST